MVGEEGTPSHRLWEMYKPGGRPRRFKTAKELAEAGLAYFRWVEENPLHEEKAFHFQGTITKTTLNKMRAMTLMGFQLHAGVSHGQWSKWRTLSPEEGGRPDLIPTMAWIENTIREQKFTGAAADLLNANIIARDLGLADRSELSGPDKGPIETTKVSARELLARKLASLASRQREGDGSEGDDGSAD